MLNGFLPATVIFGFYLKGECAEGALTKPTFPPPGYTISFSHSPHLVARRDNRFITIFLSDLCLQIIVISKPPENITGDCGNEKNKYDDASDVIRR